MLLSAREHATLQCHAHLGSQTTVPCCLSWTVRLTEAMDTLTSWSPCNYLILTSTQILLRKPGLHRWRHEGLRIGGACMVAAVCLASRPSACAVLTLTQPEGHRHTRPFSCSHPISPPSFFPGDGYARLLALAMATMILKPCCRYADACFLDNQDVTPGPIRGVYG